MKTFFKLALFTVSISALYTAIAWLLPQQEAHPPILVEVGPSSSIGPEELSRAGTDVYETVCSYCHAAGVGRRCPDLSSAGALAKSRAIERSEQTGEPYTDLDFLVESLCRPSAHLSEGFDDIMPPQVQLTPGQILAVAAFLQDQGAVATARGTDVAPLSRFGCTPGAASAAAEPVSAPPVGPPEQVWEEFGCAGCHALDATTRLVGPPLGDLASRSAEGTVYEALLDPDARLTPGDPPYPSGVMKATLDANGFYDRMTAADYRALVAWLLAQGAPEGEE